MSSETTTYNVYLVTTKTQGIGRFYHVIGSVGMGMDYDSRPSYRFRATRTFKSSVLQFQMPKAQLARFEEFASALPPPHDPRLLTESNPDPPAPDCTTWISDVLAEAKRLAEL
ncbi:hypothetical protein BDV19DRAFT_383352 [Aspergillus venezuelensis]